MENNKLKLLYGKEFVQFNNGAILIKADRAIKIQTTNEDISIKNIEKIESVIEDGKFIILEYSRVVRSTRLKTRRIIDTETGRSAYGDVRVISKHRIVHSRVGIVNNRIIKISEVGYRNLLSVLDERLNESVSVSFSRDYNVEVKSVEQELTEFNVFITDLEVVATNIYSTIANNIKLKVFINDMTGTASITSTDNRPGWEVIGEKWKTD